VTSRAGAVIATLGSEARAARMGCAALALLLAISSAPPARARPIPVCRPGGGGTPRDTSTVDFPVSRAPSLLALRAPSLFDTDASASAAASESPPTLVRRADPARAAGSRGAAVPGQDALSFNGSKTVSVEIGRNRDAALHQTLDLTLRGRVAGDVEVAATVSDQQLPFTPDGSTRELADLDRLFLSVRAPQGEVTMGDFSLDASTGEFARASRQLQGVRGLARAGGAQWDVAAASAKGERRTLEVRGEDGKQGPYDLSPRVQGESSPGVVAGSEVVWLDGMKLRRGADADYVLDYSAGMITFTTRHPIGAQSRIAVDFEQAISRYRRSIYAASSQGGLGRAGRAGRWFAGYLRDGDDSKNPLSTMLNADDVAALSGLGDSAIAASGVRYIGSGQGDYAWDESDAANAHWLHLGPGRGDYRVEFVAVGPGRGAYADTVAGDGTRFYRFMGKTMGSYSPGRPLPAPTSHQIFDVGGSARVGSVASLEAEVARSGLDRNELSSLDDGDNAGSAIRVGMSVVPQTIRAGGRSLGSLRASATYRSIGSRFEPMDRVNPSFEYERWNQAAGTYGEDRRELGVQYDPLAALSLRGELGMRSLDGGSRSLRRAFSAESRGVLVGSIRWDEAANRQGLTDGSRSRFAANLAHDRGAIRPRFFWSDERIRGQEGDSVPARSNREWSAGLGLVPRPKVEFRASYGERLDRRADPLTGITEVTARTWETGLSARPRSALSLDMGWSRRRVSEAGARTDADLAQLAVLAGNPGAAVTSELRYDATQLRQPDVVRLIVPVTAGSGSYDAFGNPRFQGDFQVVTATGAPTGRTRANVQLRLDAFPGRSAAAPAPGKSFWRGFGASTLLRVETLSRLPLGNPAYAIRPANYLDEAATLRGSVNARQTVSYGLPGGRSDLRAELGAQREQNGEFANLSIRRSGFDTRLQLRAPLWRRVRITTAGSLDRTAQRVHRTDAVDRYESVLEGRGFELELARAVGRAWTLSAIGRGRQDRDASRGGVQETWTAGPAARYASGGRLRLDGRALLGSTSRQGAYQPAALYTPVLPGRRVEYDFLGEYRLHQQVSLNFTWNGQKAPGRAVFYTGRFELRSYF